MPIIGPRNPASAELHAAKYRQRGENFDDYCVRYARTTADDAPHFRRLLEGLRSQAILPGGRQQRAVGWPFLTTAFNCFVGGTIPDDTEGIGNSLTQGMLTLRSGGGCGWDFSPLRPSGEPIRKLGDDAYASGPVSFMGMWHAMCSTIRSAGERRGAMMGVLNVHHPDIMTFVRAKADRTSLTNFNISVGATNEFMAAVEADGLYDLRFPVRQVPGGPPPRVFRTVRALDVWAAIMEQNWDWSEPGVLFLDTANGMNPLWYCERLDATNPCFTGDTKVWTSGGPRRFDDLARTGADVQVLTQTADGRLVYRTMRRPRMTRRDATLMLVTLDNGETVRCTPTHEFFLKDGRRVMAQRLRPGDRIESVYRYKANSKGYLRLTNGRHMPLEHHVPYEDGVPAGYDVYHKDEVKTNNRPDNLELKLKKSHRQHHMRGDRNPLRRMPHRNPMVLNPDCLRGDKNGRWRPEMDVGEMRRMRAEGVSYQNIANALGCSPTLVQKRLARPDNHRVVSVERLGVREDVYCGTVEETGRFFVQLGANDGVLVSNCAEQWLPPDGACLLLSLNLVKYLVPSYSRPARGTDAAHRPVRGDMITDIHDPRLLEPIRRLQSADPAVWGDGDPRRPETGRGGDHRSSSYELDLDRFADDVAVSVRACDNVFEKTVYPLPAQQAEALAKRRMGVGVTGMANALEVCGHRYGSAGYLEMQDRVLGVLRDVSYRTSIDMARSKEPFPLFDADKWLASGFGRTLPEDIRSDIKRYGLRNGLLLSIAPTGTISLTADNVSASIEPPPALEVDRVVNYADGPRTVPFNDYALEEYGVRCKTATQVPVADHVEVLCRAQRFVDNSISKTINLAGAKSEPAGDRETTFEQFKGVYIQVWRGGGKGCTTYNINGKRGAVIKERAGAQNPDDYGKDGRPKAESNGPTADRVGAPDDSCYTDPATGNRTCG